MQVSTFWVSLLAARNVVVAEIQPLRHGWLIGDGSDGNCCCAYVIVVVCMLSLL